MIFFGRWRWAAIIGAPLAAAIFLFYCGIVRPVYEAHALLTLTPATASFNDEFNALHLSAPWRLERATNPAGIILSTRAARATAARESVQAAARHVMEDSLIRQKAALHPFEADIETQAATLHTRMAALTAERDAAVAQSHQAAARRHARKNSAPHGPEAARANAVSRQVVETQMQESLLAQRARALLQRQQELKPHWRLSQAPELPTHPIRIEGWPIALGTVGGLFALGFWFLRRQRQPLTAAAPILSPVELEIISPQAPETESVLPEDPLTTQAAALYGQWLDIATLLYQPTAEPPQAIFERVAPLLRDTMDFFTAHHAVMTRYLGESTSVNELPVHVARTVVIVLLATHEAGASAEHRMGMAVAALVHDLAVVPRLGADWADIGSEVGRLSAGLLQKIPGLSAPVVSMAQDILIGMDEYPMNVWQNLPRSQALDSFAKLLRHTDRFEKVMQKQKARLNRRLNQRAAG